MSYTVPYCAKLITTYWAELLVCVFSCLIHPAQHVHLAQSQLSVSMQLQKFSEECSQELYLYVSDEEEPDLFDLVAQPEGKVGAKKMRKLEAKAEKKAQREVSGGNESRDQ